MNIASFILPKAEVSYLRDRMSLKQGLDRLHRSGFSAIPVIDMEDRYVGVVSEGDFLWNAFYFDKKTGEISQERLNRVTIRDIIQSGKVKPAYIDMTMESLLELILRQSFVPVIDDRGVFIGIVTRSEILKYYIKGKTAPRLLSDRMAQKGKVEVMKKLEEYVLSIPDFPEEGIIFRDVTSVLQDAEGFVLAVDTMQDKIKDLEYDVVVGPESRGFIFGTPIAYNNKKPFVLIRKAGKLPRETVSISYDLEYGEATIEMHKDSIKPGQRVLIVDDLIATGGTTEAMIRLIESLGGVVAGIVVLIELAGLKGRERLGDYRLESAICYPGK